MNKRITSVFSVLVVVVFIAYIVFDTTRRPQDQDPVSGNGSAYDTIPEKWNISRELVVKDGQLKAVSVSTSGNIYAGGDSFVSCYSSDLRRVWSLKTSSPVTAIANWGDSIYASTIDLILVIGSDGTLKDEWGPFEDKSFITSVASNRNHVVYGDAGNKMVVLLDKQGRVIRITGQGDGQFVIPSPYFDVALGTNDTLFVANTGHRRIETRSPDGKIISMFGEPGMAPEAFCGCCNPAHFIVTPEGFVTAEKGINRIKIMGKEGQFIEFVSSRNKFVSSVPLDLASADSTSIYAANPSDSRIYIFSRN